MVFPTAFVDGLVLAATIHDDRQLDAVGAGLAPGLARTLAERLAAFGRLTREERHDEVRAIVGQLAPVPVDAVLPPRVALILAGSVPRSVGRKWAEGAPEVRRRFRVSRGLKRTLRHLAAPAAPPGVAEEERAAARRAEGLEPSRAAVLRAIADRHDDRERALGALILGVEGSAGGDDSTRRLRRTGRELACIWDRPWRA